MLLTTIPPPCLSVSVRNQKKIEFPRTERVSGWAVSFDRRNVFSRRHGDTEIKENEIGTAVADCDECSASCDSSVFSVHESMGKWFSHRGHRDHRGEDL